MSDCTTGVEPNVHFAIAVDLPPYCTQETLEYYLEIGRALVGPRMTVPVVPKPTLAWVPPVDKIPAVSSPGQQLSTGPCLSAPPATIPRPAVPTTAFVSVRVPHDNQWKRITSVFRQQKNPEFNEYPMSRFSCLHLVVDEFGCLYARSLFPDYVTVFVGNDSIDGSWDPISSEDGMYDFFLLMRV